jgi:hypothetical protein
MRRLLHIGFRKVGQWKRDDVGIKFDLIDLQDSNNILYAFISNEEVLYVGKTTQSLTHRMSGYQNPGPSQKTNINNNRLISELLSTGKEVSIYAMPDNGLLHYGIFRLSLAAGLEDSIVVTLKPRWNKTGV